MLSIQTPPPDVPCPCSDSHERASPKQLALPDLPKDHAPLPIFSIRDYVLTSRSKDIKKNWPFSLKNLQLCLKHGVKDVLPPFGSTDTARNQSFVRCTVESDLAQGNCFSKIDGELKIVDARDCSARDTSDVGLNQKLLDPCTYESSCRSGGENDFPSTTTSEIESAAAHKLPSPQSEVGTSLVEVRAPLYKSQKKENTCRLPGKKCKLIVKFGGNFNRCSTEDIASNTTTVLETMASKVCPVCKTFSSSSNTTLNAHIDQCLSGESTPKWTSDSKLNKHRIKPRKTRLMVDVYSTAKRCTLEELDRRNGTNWATTSSLPSQNTMTLAAEGRKQRVSHVHPEEADDVGAVYIDSSGTKVRILSKLSYAPIMSNREDVEPRKLFKGGKVHKLISTKKKMKHGLKDQKYLKHTPQSKKLRSYDVAHKSQIYGGQEKFNVTKVNWEKSKKIQNLKSFEHAQPSDSGTLGTGLARKVKSKGAHQPLRCELHVASNLLVETNQFNSSDSLEDRSHVQRLANSSENAGSFTEVRDRMESNSERPLRKRMRSSLVVPRVNRDAERTFSSVKQKTNRSKGIVSTHEVLKWKPPSCVSALVSNKAIETHAGSPNDSDTSPCASVEPSRSCHGIPSKEIKLSSLRKKVSSSSQPPGVESKFHDPRKGSTCKNSQMHVMAEMNKEVVVWRAELNQEQDLMQTCTVNRSGREYVSDDEDSLDKSINTSQRDEELVGRSNDFSGRDSYSLSDEYDSNEFTKSTSQTRCDVLEGDSSSKEAEGACLSNPVDPEFHKVGSCMKIQSDSLQHMEDYTEPLCGEETRTCTNEPNFVDGPVMFSGNVGMNCINVQSSHEFNREAEQGNSFLEVDPIPIPGPPGSFLPSPGGDDDDDDSSEEDFQGHSSLTTSRLQSSQDQLELVNNRGSSDSPVSATSTISNSTTARFDVSYTEPLLGSCMVKDKFGAGLFHVGVEASVENALKEAGRIDVDGEGLKASNEKGHPNFRNDDQRCCCSRKDRVTQGAALNYEEPLLLRRHTFSVGKQMSGNPNSRPDHLDIVRTDSVAPFPLHGASDVGVKFSGRSDCDLGSPSAPNPVLRLMGKNLVVANRDEDTFTTAQVEVEATSSSTGNSHPTSQLPPFPVNIRNQDYNSLHPFINQGLVSFSHTRVLQPFDGGVSNDFRSQPSFQSALHAPFHIHAEPPESRGEPILLARPRNRPTMYNLEKPDSVANHRHKNSVSNNELIIIDDDDDGCQSEAGKQVEVSYHCSPHASTTTLQGVHSQATPSTRQANTIGPLGWSCASEGPPGMVQLQRTLYNGAAPPRPRTSHLRSSLYYSPSLL